MPDRPPYPGVIIEEMLDSVSVHSVVEENENYPVALIGEQNGDKEPDVRNLYVNNPTVSLTVKNISSGARVQKYWDLWMCADKFAWFK